MYSQTLISIIVFWVAALCFRQVVSFDTIITHKLNVINKLNTLVRHSGWRSMDYVKIKKRRNSSDTTEDPMSTILEAVSSERNPVDEFNVQERYDELFTVLNCKYVEVIYKCRSLVHHFVRVCRNEKLDSYKKPDYSLQKYNDCFRLMLIKLHSLSPRFKCMADALEYVQSLGLIPKRKSPITVALEKLTDYTLTVGPRTSSRLSEHGNNEQTVDLEIKAIDEYFWDTIKSLVNRYSSYYCVIPPQSYNPIETLNEYFESKKRHNLIPEDTTMVQYVRDEMDCYMSGIIDSCYFDLGFANDLSGNVIIRDH